MTPGIYAYLRDPAVLDEWKARMRPEFLWEAKANEPLFLLVPIDCGPHRQSRLMRPGHRGRRLLRARDDGALRAAAGERGEWFYRRLFWECGLIGQVLYLEAEAAGGRATGIGCYYDDPVHDLLGLSGTPGKSLYHFSMGLPVEDTRLTSEPGYDWER
jgi:hypothetical protein